MNNNKVLIVDTDPFVLEILKQIVEKTGNFNIAVTTSGEHAENLLKKGDYFLVISEFDLEEDEQGDRILKTAKDLNPDCITVVISDRPQFDAVFKHQAPCADFCAQKPDVSSLAKVLKKII